MTAIFIILMCSFLIIWRVRKIKKLIEMWDEG